MMLLHPEVVEFGEVVLPGVVGLTVSRTARGVGTKETGGGVEIVEWGDDGPQVAFADVPSIRVTIEITRRIRHDELQSIMPGEQAELRAFVSPRGARSDVERRRIKVTCVVLSVETTLAKAAASGAATREVTAGGVGGVQTITLIGISSNGKNDPIVIEEVGALLAGLPPKP
jgi:hypothetical protein